MPTEQTDRERVDFALKTENAGHDFYEMAKVHTKHKLARAAFEQLAKEETHHVVLIEGLAKRISEGGAEDTDAGDARSKEAIMSDIKSIYESAAEAAGEGDLDPVEAYKKATEMEKEVTALYHRYSKECNAEEARHLFDVLYREEQGHLDMLEDMLGYMSNPGDWFIDRDMTLIDGG